MTIYHKHHITPKHMGGTDDPSNLVLVTIEQHAELHKQLWEDLGCWQDELAWKTLSGQIPKAEAIREAQRRGRLGYKASEETRKKISLVTKGVKQKKEHVEARRLKLIGLKKTFKDKEKWKKNQSLAKLGKYVGEKNPFYGKCHSEETIEKNRQWHIGHTYNRGRVFGKVDCPKCGRSVSSNRLSFHQRSMKCETTDEKRQS